MSLNGALQIGRSSLAAHSAAMEVASNNMANVATPGYTRQIPNLTPYGGIEQSPGIFIGMGVNLNDITRATDEALLTRIRTSVSNYNAALTRQDLLTQIESIQGGIDGLTSLLDEFSNTWSTLSNKPDDIGMRGNVIQSGDELCNYIQRVYDDLVVLRAQVDDSIRDNVNTVNNVFEKIADINVEIAMTERGIGTASSLRDARDQLLAEASKYLDISTIEQSNGMVDVFIGSLPVVLGDVNRGIQAEFVSIDGERAVRMRLSADGSDLVIDSGKIGQLIESRGDDVNASVEKLNEFSRQLIFDVNRLHSQGQGAELITTVTGTYSVNDTDAALSLPEAGLHFSPEHGSFVLKVTNIYDNPPTTKSINMRIDMDGQAPADMSLNDLVNLINANLVAEGLGGNVTATVTSDHKLQISVDNPDEYRFGFADDTSGVLAALGINTFFDGDSAENISVNDVLMQFGNLNLLAAADGIEPAGTAINITGLLQDTSDGSIRNAWELYMTEAAVKGSGANQEVSSTLIISESLDAQREAISGVSIDEEAINLLSYQRAFQGSARFISVIDEMMGAVLGLLR